MKQVPLEAPFGGLYWSIDVDAIQDKGLALSRDIDVQTREQIAKALDLLTLDMLRVDVELCPLSRKRVSAKGVLEARLQQACVITLEPITTQLKEEIDTQFWCDREALEDYTESKGDASELILNPLGNDGPEAVEDGKIDLGRFIFEIVSSAIDPYPRKPDAEFKWQEEGATKNLTEETAKTNPFAVLNALKKERPD